MMTVLPDRIARLRDEAVRRGGSFACAYPPCLDDAALWRAWEPGMSVVQVRAAMLREIAAIAPVEIGPDERIVGLHLRPLNAGWLGRGDLADADYAARLGELGVPADQADDATRKAARWLSRTDLPSEIGVAADDSHLGRGAWEGNGQDVFWAFGWMENHSIRDYPKAVRIGFGGLRDEILSARAGARLADPDFPQRDNFWRAALDVCEAACILGRRYAAEARRLAASATDPADRLRLEAIAGRCDRVPERGARTLGEAVQGFWFAHLVTCGEDGINANSIGHLDHFLLPAYQADLHAARAAGRPESEVSDEADEWLAELGCRMYLDYDVQAITLGGCDAEGKNAANPLSMKILETTRALGTIRDISLRVRKDTPDDLLRLAAEMVVAGGGVPFFFNDDAFLPASPTASPPPTPGTTPPSAASNSPSPARATCTPSPATSTSPSASNSPSSTASTPAPESASAPPPAGSATIPTSSPSGTPTTHRSATSPRAWPTTATAANSCSAPSGPSPAGRCCATTASHAAAT
jgi:hypothetical protein